MDEFIRRIIEQQEMMRRLMEGPAKYFRENEAAITRMQDLAHSMDTGVLERAAAAASANNLVLRVLVQTANGDWR